MEETFQAGKGLAGLDEHQVRRFTSWSRWVTLAMLAHAFLAVVRADEHARHPAPDGSGPNVEARTKTSLGSHVGGGRPTTATAEYVGSGPAGGL